MRIGSRVSAVGAIPIVIAACIAVAAILLLQQIDQARRGAAAAATLYQTLLTAVMAHHEYVQAEPERRIFYRRRFIGATEKASAGIGELRRLQPADEGLAGAERRLTSYVADMGTLVDATSKIDAMVRDMSARAATLSGLGDQARDRQHAANVNNSAMLDRADASMRETRDILEAAYALRVALSALAVKWAGSPAPLQPGNAGDRIDGDGERFRQLSVTLSDRLKRADIADADGTVAFEEPALQQIARLAVIPDPPASDATARRMLVDAEQWADDVVKAYSAKFRSSHELTARLLGDAVQAYETELATETMTTKLLKQSYRSAAALARQDEATARAILDGGERLTDILAALPIHPSIHASMIAAYRLWLDGLRTTIDMVSRQNALTSEMDRASTEMIDSAYALDARLSSSTDRTARSIRIILILGAMGGLLFGGVAATVAARSITAPLVALQTEIMVRAHDPSHGRLHHADRRDELGDIARAANSFLGEISRREQALRLAKDRADRALDTLKQTQVELIRAERLASLGQLVAGVAHEINTPVGIALTTATVVDEELRLFGEAVKDGKISRRALDRMVERSREGLDLLVYNLTRSADLIQSFKQVAADQVSGQRREILVHAYLHELMTSLNPMLRKAGHKSIVVCSETLVFGCASGALSQILTNLIVNAVTHAFAADIQGEIRVEASAVGTEAVRIVVSDDGRGIPSEDLVRIFDPFFTTRRTAGSTGLGLNIVWNIVTSSFGGQIDVASTLGCGTRFTITLPRSRAAADVFPATGDIDA